MIIILSIIIRSLFSIQPFLFQLVDESNVEITLESFKYDILKYDYILESASYTYLMSAFQYFKKQHDTTYNDTKTKMLTLLLKHVSIFHSELEKVLL